MYSAALAVLVIEVRQFQQMVVRRVRGTDEMGQQRSIVAVPRALVQNVAAEIFHIACIGVVDIDDEGAAWTQVRAHGSERELLRFARGDVAEGAQRDKGKAELLSQIQGADILLHQRTERAQPGLLQPVARDSQHCRRSIDPGHFIAVLGKREKDAPAPTCQLEYLSAAQLGEVAVHVQIFAELCMLDIIKGRD